MTQVADGGHAALSELYDRYAPEVLVMGLKLYLEMAMAEWLVMETFWLVWQQANLFHPQSTRFPVWLRRLARQAYLSNRSEIK